MAGLQVMPVSGFMPLQQEPCSIPEQLLQTLPIDSQQGQGFGGFPWRRHKKRFDLAGETRYFLPLVGVWRSLVAHLHGVQGVASSNLVTPTNLNRESAQ